MPFQRAIANQRIKPNWSCQVSFHPVIRMGPSRPDEKSKNIYNHAHVPGVELLPTHWQAEASPKPVVIPPAAGRQLG
jgi:hypothetical protein